MAVHIEHNVSVVPMEHAVIHDLQYSILVPPHAQVRLLFRARLHDVLMDWDPVLKAHPSLVSLGYAFVRRLARNSQILVLQPEDLGLHTKKHNCSGCPKCNGPVWKFKTETVATLYAVFCECFKCHVASLYAMFC